MKAGTNNSLKYIPHEKVGLRPNKTIAPLYVREQPPDLMCVIFLLPGTSYLNRTEATNVEKALTRFLQCGINPSQLGVITPYEGQRAHVVNVLLRNGPLRQDLYKAIEVSSVDAFQVNQLTPLEQAIWY